MTSKLLKNTQFYIWSSLFLLGSCMTYFDYGLWTIIDLIGFGGLTGFAIYTSLFNTNIRKEGIFISLLIGLVSLFLVTTNHTSYFTIISSFIFSIVIFFINILASKNNAFNRNGLFSLLIVFTFYSANFIIGSGNFTEKDKGIILLTPRVFNELRIEYQNDFSDSLALEHFIIARHLSSEKEYAKAIIEYNNALKIENNNNIALSDLMLAYFYNDDIENTLLIGKDLLVMFPDDAVVKSQLGHIYFYIGEYDNSLEILNQAIDLCPTCGHAYWNRGLTKTKLNFSACEICQDFTKGLKLMREKQTEEVNNIEQTRYKQNIEFMKKYCDACE